MKWSEVLSNRVSIIIIRYIDHMQFCCLFGCFIYHILSYSFGSILYHCIYGCMFCVLLFNFIIFFFFNVCSVLYILFHCVALCTVCV